MIKFAISIYIGALVLANLIVAKFGPAITPINALVLVGLDMSVRDWLNVQIPRRSMAILIPVAGGIAYVLDPAVRFIAIASTVAFIVSEWVEWLCFTWTKGTWLSRSIKSNTAAAVVDSIIFPTLAFGHIMPMIVLLQFGAKVVGSSFWAYLLNKVPFQKRS